MHASALDRLVQDLYDSLDDLSSSSSQNAANILVRFVTTFRSEPLASFLTTILPPVTDEKAATVFVRGEGMVGGGKVTWPAERAERVALQVALIEHLSERPKDLLWVAHEYYNSGLNDFSADVHQFAEALVRPMLRDLGRLAEGRVVSSVLLDAISALPRSGDAILDGLLLDAVTKFRNSSPSARKEALERLWDSWERLKTIDVVANKKLSTATLLNNAANDAAFREIIEAEARALTSIGNDFHIRHFETNRTPLGSAAHIDYLFHRLFAFIYLLLCSRSAGAPAS